MQQNQNIQINIQINIKIFKIKIFKTMQQSCILMNKYITEYNKTMYNNTSTDVIYM